MSKSAKKVALATGGSQGIGAAIAKRLAADGASVAITYAKDAGATYGQLDVLVNNAGTAIPKTFEESTPEEIDRVIDINIRGVFVTTQVTLKHMKDGGRIINIGSAVGERVQVPGLVPYSDTKGAVKGHEEECVERPLAGVYRCGLLRRLS
jgi:3-oxoacyl-[acyl-carrier protein] reductase